MRQCVSGQSLPASPAGSGTVQLRPACVAQVSWVYVLTPSAPQSYTPPALATVSICVGNAGAKCSEPPAGHLFCPLGMLPSAAPSSWKVTVVPQNSSSFKTQHIVKTRVSPSLGSLLCQSQSLLPLCLCALLFV